MAFIYKLSHLSLHWTTFLRMPTVPQSLEGRQKPSSSFPGGRGAMGNTAMLRSYNNTDGGDYGWEKLLHSGSSEDGHRLIQY